MLLSLVVLGIVGLQIVGGGSTNRRAKPGPTRGDMVLTEDALPAEISGWTRARFIPAPPVDELPEGQYWWVHQWQYQKDRVTALVSFDQLGEDRWHELTYCYRILDWVIDERSILTDESSAGKYVVARMSKDDGQQGLLVFSVFFENGEWDLPPDCELSLVNAVARENETRLIDRVLGRLQQPDVHPYAETVVTKTLKGGIRRALQCQVFISTTKPITDSLLAAGVDLHLRSRSHFRSNWLTRISSSRARH